MKTVNELIAEFQTNVHTNLDSPNRGSVFTIEASVGSSYVSVPIAYCNSYAEAFGTFFERCIEDIEGQITVVKREMDDYEIDVDDEDFDDWIDDLEGPITVCGMQYCASRVLKEIDSVAYRCAKVDYEDGLDKSDFDDYQQLELRLESLEEELDVLRTDLDTANEAAAEIEEGDENVRKLLVIG